MATIVLNRATYISDPPAQTWGELLGRVDRDLEGSGRIVTAVRLDDVEEPAFRDPELAVRELSTISQIDIQTGTPDELLRSCLEEAITGADALAEATTRIGDAFRRGDLEGANQDLAELARGIATLVTIVGAAGLAMRVQSIEVGEPDGEIPDAIAELDRFLQDLIAAQRDQDWITVADILQYDVEPSLRRWRSMLAALVPVATAA